MKILGIRSVYLPITLVFIVLSISCKNSNNKDELSVLGERIEDVEKDLAMPPLKWIDSRVEKTRRRLDSSDAGKIVWQAMEAHGGLENWYRKGALSFRFDYQPLDGGTPRDTYQIVDTWSNRARHFKASDSAQMFGWDGRQAWVKATDGASFEYNMRFWSLTPYYFLAQPFVLDGDGVLLELMEPREFEGNVCDVVKVSFAEGTGDAPDDYYILYMSKDSHLLKVIRYIVSYPGYFKDGGHLPEKFMKLLDSRRLEGFLFPQGYKTYWLDNDGAGEHITNITVSEIEFRPNTKDSVFRVPEGARLQDKL